MHHGEIEIGVNNACGFSQDVVCKHHYHTAPSGWCRDLLVSIKHPGEAITIGFYFLDLKKKTNKFSYKEVEKKTAFVV